MGGSWRQFDGIWSPDTEQPKGACRREETLPHRDAPRRNRPRSCVLPSRWAEPRVINVDGHSSYPPAIAELKQIGALSRRCQSRPCPYLNDVLEQDHRFVKKRIAAGLWFRSVDGALRTIAGYEAMNMIRKGQVTWLAKGDVVGRVRFIERAFGIAA
jgi:IS6 family transposase